MTEAARRRFSPEFMNRIDGIIVFRALGPDDLRRILDIELNQVQERIYSTAGDASFFLTYTDAARSFLIENGFDRRYGARRLKRTIEQHVVFPLSGLMATRQISPGDVITVDVAPDKGRLVFLKCQDMEPPVASLQEIMKVQNGN